MKTTKLGLTTFVTLALIGCGGEENNSQANNGIPTFSKDAEEVIYESASDTNQNAPEKVDNSEERLDLATYSKPVSERIDLSTSENIDEIAIEAIRSINYLMTTAVNESEVQEGTFGSDSNRRAEYSRVSECVLNGSVTSTFKAPAGLTFDGQVALGQGETATVLHNQCAQDDYEGVTSYYDGQVEFMVSSGAYNGYVLVNGTALTANYKNYGSFTESEVEYFVNGSVDYVFNEGHISLSANEYTVYEDLETNLANFNVNELNSSLVLSSQGWEFDADDITIELSNVNAEVDISIDSAVILNEHTMTIDSANLTVASDNGVLKISISDGGLIWFLDTDNDGQTDVSNTISKYSYQIWM